MCSAIVALVTPGNGARCLEHQTQRKSQSSPTTVATLSQYTIVVKLPLITEMAVNLDHGGSKTNFSYGILHTTETPSKIGHFLASSVIPLAMSQSLPILYQSFSYLHKLTGPLTEQHCHVAYSVVGNLLQK